MSGSPFIRRERPRLHALHVTWHLWLGLAALAPFLCAAAPRPAAPADPFVRWAAVFIAGESHAADGALTDGFDNARRDVGAALERAGFSPANVAELSVRPQRYAREPLKLANLNDVSAELARTAARAPDGCLVYLTTHGSPYGAPVGDDLLTPSKAAQVIGAACGERPTVVIISACFSGIFIRRLSGPNRMILTAARPDRTSFGCGQTDRYPYFDACLLKVMPDAHDFLALADKTRVCIDAREKAERLIPPSQPQVYVGAKIGPLLRTAAFEKQERGRAGEAPL